MTKRLFRVAVDAASESADGLKKPIQMVVEAASDKKAKEAALTAISQNTETAAKTKGKVVVDVEEFNKQPVTEKFQVASPQEVRRVAASATGKKSGEMGEAIIQPHKLTTADGTEYDLPAFDPKDPKYQVMGMRSATGEDLFRLGEANIREQNMTIFPNSWEKALSNEANPKMRTLGRAFGISDDMDHYANNAGFVKRAFNTGWRTGLPALGVEMIGSLSSGEPDGNGGTTSGPWVGKGLVSRGVGAIGGLAGPSEEETASAEQNARKKLAEQAKSNRSLIAVKKMSPAGIPSRQAIDVNNQAIARMMGDKSENGALAHRTFEQAISPFWKSAQGGDDAERISNATRTMFQRQSADQIVESLLFGASKAEKDVYTSRAQRQTSEGQRPDEFKPVAHESFKKLLEKVQSDDPNTPYITFPSDMITSYHDGQPRTGLKVTRALPDGSGENVFVIPVIVPKKTRAEQELQGTKAKKGDSDVPTLTDRLSENKYEIIYLDANPKNPRKPEIPADEIIW